MVKTGASAITSARMRVSSWGASSPIIPRLSTSIMRFLNLSRRRPERHELDRSLALQPIGKIRKRMLESIGVGRDIAVFLIGHFNHPAARRAERCGLIKAFSASEQDGTPEYD